MPRSSKSKIQKARTATLGHTQGGVHSPQKLDVPLSQESQDTLNTISNEIQRASTQRVDSEEPEAFIDEAETLDPLFSNRGLQPEIHLASIARRKEIEARCESLRVDDLFVSGEIRQRVTIIPNRLVVGYRTLKSREDLYLKSRLSELKDEAVQFAENQYMMMLLAAHICSYNGKDMPMVTDKKGEVQDVEFEKRFAVVAEIPQVLIEDIWINYLWFEDRVRGALAPENLKNG